ncbi:Hypp9318 [Branchiostoma lanceolatum]|uniref:Hypp9318 protein n=1 Tax=Branchiostoma lanceolatum TaxID=7740 RepID=A0A8S4MLP9_BRALA|nr:Hypp9318 [Branchiostoma lanceolatum]
MASEVTPGLGQRKFPYRKLKDREVSLEGLPAEVNLKNLHNMGTDRLRLVLKNKDNIRIHVEQELLHLQQAIQHSAQGQREEVTLQQEEQGGDGAVGTSTCSGQGERRGAFSLIEALSKK